MVVSVVGCFVAGLLVFVAGVRPLFCGAGLRVLRFAGVFWSRAVGGVVGGVGVCVGRSAVRSVVVGRCACGVAVPSAGFLVVGCFVGGVFFGGVCLNALWCFMSIKYDVRI